MSPLESAFLHQRPSEESETGPEPETTLLSVPVTARQQRTEVPHQIVVSLARALHATFRSRTRAWPREVVSWHFQSDSGEGLKRSLGSPHQEGANRQTGHNTHSSQDNRRHHQRQLTPEVGHFGLLTDQRLIQHRRPQTGRGLHGGRAATAGSRGQGPPRAVVDAERRLVCAAALSG